MSDPAPKASAGNPILGWVFVAAVGVVAFVATRPKPPSPPGPGPKGPAAPPASPSRASLGVKLVKADGGLGIGDVFSGSNAARAGLVVGDVILKVEGSPATEARVLTDRLEALAPGQALHLEVRHADGTVEPRTVDLATEAGFELGLARTLIAAGVDQLLRARRPDGLWPHYQDAARPSVAVTALAAWTLARVGDELPDAGKAALEEARARLVAAQVEDGGLADPAELYPHRAYATALAVLALEGQAEPARVAARGRMLAWLADAQVGEAHGFDAIDSRYGGWSYYDTYASARLRTDVSTLRFATLALASGALPDDAPAWERARLWLDLCQNRTVVSAPDAPAYAREAQLRDGGFAFGPRASKALSEPAGESLVVFHSYGSATADGALALCCLDGVDRRREKATPALRPELTSALAWLVTRWDLAGVPGFPKGAEEWTQGVHLYYLAGLAELLHRVGAWRVVRSGEARAWAPELVRLVGTLHERAGKRFKNPSGLMHEDEPSIAASFGVLALCAARDRLALGAGGDVSGTAGAASASEPEGAPPRDAVGRGAVVFRRCAGCHQDDGLGNGPSLVGVGDRARGRWKDQAGAAAGLRAFLADPSKGPTLFPDAHNRMPPQQLEPGEVDDVIRFLLGR